MYNIPQHEFEKLKNHFDLNSCFEGSEQLSKIINDVIEMAFKPDQYGQNFSQPLVTMGELEIVGAQNTWETPSIGLSPEFLKSIENMAKEIQSLRETINTLESMHNEFSDIDHAPTIISTKEQYEEMKPKMDKEERVFVHTTFDKALNVL